MTHGGRQTPLLKIYGHAGSINVRKVLWTCAEIGIAFSREDWGGAHRSTSDAAFRALNPFGLIPVIDDSGVVVRESNTIVRYLATTRKRDDLLPTDSAKRANVEAWMDWQASDFNNTWRAAFLGLVRKNPDFQDPAVIAKSATAFNQAVRTVDDALAKTNAFLCGDAFTAADVVIGLSIHRWLSTPIDRPRLDHVTRYYARLCERPGFQTHGRDGGP